MAVSVLRFLCRTCSSQLGNRSLGLRFVVALAAALAVTSAGALASEAVARSCGVPGHVLVQRDGVVVWTAHRPDRYGNEGSVFMCASPSGRTVLLQRSDQYLTSMVTDASVTQLRFAGHFVGFFLRTNVEVYSKFLIVFDRLHGRIELRDLAECDNNDECTGPNITAYRLAYTGWVAELWPQVVSGAAGLLATNGSGHYQLDLTRISDLKLSRGTLSWISPFGVASVRLGTSVITPPAPRELSACQLLTAAELAPVLGPSTNSSSSRANCEYTSATYPGRTLAVKRITGLTRAQMLLRERALATTFPVYCDLGEWWPADDNFYVLERARTDVCGYPGTDVHFVLFSNGAEVSLDLTAPGASGASQVAHLSNVALDRLFGVPIHRAP